jgi:uncharacterized protein (DUF2164 family)
MSIELKKETRKVAISSLQKYINMNFEEEIGNVAADALLQFFLAEIGPSIYNQAVADVRDRLHARVMEIDLEVFEDEFTYWQKAQRKREGR